MISNRKKIVYSGEDDTMHDFFIKKYKKELTLLW